MSLVNLHLNQRAVVVAGFAIGLSALSTGCGRPNPRIKAIHTVGGNDVAIKSAQTFTYDDSGYLLKVARTFENSASDNTASTLTWDSGKLKSVKSADGTQTFSYDGDRISGYARTLPGNGTESGTVVHGDNGKLASLKLNQEANGLTSRAQVIYGYDDDGALVKNAFSLTASNADGSSTQAFTTTFQFKDSKLSSFATVDDATNVTTSVAASYDDKDRITKLVRSHSDVDFIEDTDFTYGDDGLLAEINAYGTVSTFSYESGDAKGIEMAPNDMAFLFDLKGQSHTEFADGVVPRLTGLLW